MSSSRVYSIFSLVFFNFRFRIALDYGLVPTVFEKGGEIGGTWVYKPYETEGTKVIEQESLINILLSSIPFCIPQVF